jgi:hypothetical protein
MSRTFRIVAALAVFALAAGCAPKTSQQCAPSGAGTAVPLIMLSPAPGTTGLPTSGVIVEFSYAPTQGSLRLVARGTGTVVLGGPFMPATAQGNATPPPGAVVSALPTLAAATTYDVFVDFVFLGCPGVSPNTLQTTAFGTLATR